MSFERVDYDLLDDDTRELIEAAKAVRANASAPYSGFCVGAAIRTGSGKVFSGCNVEIASYSLTCCAERVAVFKAVSEGEREITSVAVICPGDRPTTPCGACRQVLSEFGSDVTVWMSTVDNVVERAPLSDLFPGSLVPDEVIAAIRARHLKKSSS